MGYSAGVMVDGVGYWLPEGEWTNNASLVEHNVNVFRVSIMPQFGIRYHRVHFYVMGNDGNWIEVHKIGFSARFGNRPDWIRSTLEKFGVR